MCSYVPNGTFGRIFVFILFLFIYSFLYKQYKSLSSAYFVVFIKMSMLSYNNGKQSNFYKSIDVVNLGFLEAINYLLIL